MIIASKVSGRSDMDWFRPGGKNPKLDEENIRYAVEHSLKRLQTDYIDLYQLHWPDRPYSHFGADDTVYIDRAPTSDTVSIEETIGALGRLVEEGKIRYVGLSNETPWGVAKFLQAHRDQKGPRIVSIQNAFNLVNRTFEIGLAEFAMREHVGLLAYSPLGQGYLTGKYQRGARPPGARTTLFNRGMRYEKPGVEEAIDLYLALAKEIGWDPAQLALAFVTSRCFVTSNIIGATNMTQLKTALDSADCKITPEIESCINAIHHVTQNRAP